jgi:ADP-ribose pyrophosphatase YjhB (NUDIX family)
MNSDIQRSTSGGGVVLNKDGDVLVVSQSGTSWSLPKGRVDAGEDPLAAAKREIYEESGVIDLAYVKELGSYERFAIGLNGGEDSSRLKTIVMFMFTTKQMLLNPVDPANPEARWVPQDQVEALLTHPKDKEFFRTHLADIQNAPQ